MKKEKQIFVIEKNSSMKRILFISAIFIFSFATIYLFRGYILGMIEVKGLHIAPKKEPHLFFLLSFKIINLSFHKIINFLNIRKRGIQCAL
jgi:uncharacterized protein with PQ loop repeat